MKGRKRTYEDFLLGTPQDASTSSSSPSIRNIFSEPGTLDQPANSTDRAHLCHRCARIDFDKIFNLASSELGDSGIPVTETRKDVDYNCSLCKLVLSFGYEESAIVDNGYHLRALDSIKVLKLKRTAIRVESNPSIVVVAVLKEADTKFGGRSQGPLNTAITRGLIVPVSLGSSTLSQTDPALQFRGRRVRSDQINFKLLQSWIQDCLLPKKGHVKCKYKPKQRDLGMNIIDCFTRDIVSMDKGTEYIALSYVWGKEQLATTAIETAVLVTPNCVPNPAPATIEDSMAVVLGLGMRYLWVDRYCIPNTPSKHTSIQNMGLVYEGAVATIVAVSGNHSDSGLSGISLPRRIQPDAETNAGTLVSTLQHVSCHISESKWINRGWTYQEAFLSWRCLFFTTDQVYFACRDCTRAESILQHPSKISDPSRETLEPGLMTLKHQIDFRITYQGAPTLTHHIKEYTSRSLSYPTDGLRAFQGMLARLDHYSYWGVPFVSHDKTQDLLQRGRAEYTRAFLKGMWWTCVGPIRGESVIARRAELPTWCWASLVGEISCPDTLYYWNERRDRRPTAAVLVEGFDGSLNDIFSLLESNVGQGRVVKNRTRYLQVTAFVARVTVELNQATSPGSYYGAMVKLDSSKTFRASISIDMFTDASLMARLEQDSWDVLALSARYEWLVLEWEGTTAYRVGKMSLYSMYAETQVQEVNLPGEIKTIRLG